MQGDIIVRHTKFVWSQNKKLLKNNQIQLNLHDGTNILSKGKISIGDSVYVDSSSKIKKEDYSSL